MKNSEKGYDDAREQGHTLTEQFKYKQSDPVYTLCNITVTLIWGIIKIIQWKITLYVHYCCCLVDEKWSVIMCGANYSLLIRSIYVFTSVYVWHHWEVTSSRNYWDFKKSFKAHFAFFCANIYKMMGYQMAFSQSASATCAIFTLFSLHHACLYMYLFIWLRRKMIISHDSKHKTANYEEHISKIKVKSLHFTAVLFVFS